MKKKNDELSKKVNTDSVLSTVSECTASTNSSDIAGASALAELKDDSEWKYLGVVSGGTTLPYPQFARYLRYDIHTLNTDSTLYNHYTGEVDLQYLPNNKTLHEFFNGYYFTENNHSACNIRINTEKETIGLSLLTFGGVSETNDALTTVWYK